MNELTSIRDPYSFPRLENDNTFNGVRSMQRQEYMEPTHLAQSKDPWHRLNSNHTLSSTRHQVYNFDPQVPLDQLDFRIKAEYDQHTDYSKASNEAFYQAETLGIDHGRVLKNRLKLSPHEAPPLNHPLRVNCLNKKESLFSIKMAIEGVHSQATNKGYTRKPDGGFFTS